MQSNIQKELSKIIENWIEMNGGFADITSNSPHFFTTIKQLVDDISPYLGE